MQGNSFETAELASEKVISQVLSALNILFYITTDGHPVLDDKIVKKIERIEDELRSMMGHLEKFELRTHHAAREQDFRKWGDELKEVARYAEYVINKFVIKPVEGGGWGLFRYLFEKYKFGKRLVKMERWMEEIQKKYQMVTDEEASSLCTRSSHLPDSHLQQFENDQTNDWSSKLHSINRNLPGYLRRCLFYFEHFPAEFDIPVRRLVLLWVAEGLASNSEREEPPVLVAERYLEELISRGMVQVAQRKHNGKVKTCRFPSDLRRLWLRQTNEYRFQQYHEHQEKPIIIRRVSDCLLDYEIWYHDIHPDNIYPTTPKHTFKTYYKHVHAFLSFDTRERGSGSGQQVGNFLEKCISRDCFLLLRMLDLECVYKPKLPDCVRRLTRLTYLGLRRTELDSLPSSISSLLKLQTLDLKHTSIHTLPSSIWKMELRHLFLSNKNRTTEFPPQPKDNSLSDLQTLWGLFVDEESPVKDYLDRLVNITKLGLACQSTSNQEAEMIAKLEAVADWITTLKYLRSLRLKSRDVEGQPWILHLKSFEKNVNLTDMYLLGSLSRSSVSLSEFPRSLVDLTLSHSKLEVDPMILLKEFPNLQTLCLLAESYTGTTMVCESQSFPKLDVLKFWKLEQLEEWKIEHGALPCLRQLEIRSCQNLKRLPDGLKHVNTLLELKLTNMPMKINAGPDNIPPNCKVD